MSLNDFCIYSDIEFFEHVFPLKKNVSTSMHEAIGVCDYVNMPTSSPIVRDLVDDPRKSKRHTVRLVLVMTLLPTF